jgi:uncharacterized protein (TIGR02145 family)
LDQTWGSRTTGARTIYAHSQTNLVKYGFLYNWYTSKGIATAGSTNFKRICPTGWHVPSEGEWKILASYLGGDKSAGGKMKSTTGWTANTGATNESGFTGLPGGIRVSNGGFSNLGAFGAWWSTSENSNYNVTAFNLSLLTNDGSSYRLSDFKDYGLSVRCLRD